AVIGSAAAAAFGAAIAAFVSVIPASPPAKTGFDTAAAGSLADVGRSSASPDGEDVSSINSLSPMEGPRYAGELDLIAVTNRLAFALIYVCRAAAPRQACASDTEEPVLNVRRGSKLCGTAGPYHLAALDQIMPVGDADQRLHVLVDQQDRLPGSLELCETLPDLGADERRQALRRFVQNQEARIGHEGA